MADLHIPWPIGVRIGPLLSVTGLRKEITMELQRCESLAQAAERAGISRKTLRRRIASGQLPVFSTASLWRQPARLGHWRVSVSSCPRAGGSGRLGCAWDRRVSVDRGCRANLSHAKPLVGGVLHIILTRCGVHARGAASGYVDSGVRDRQSARGLAVRGAACWMRVSCPFERLAGRLFTAFEVVATEVVATTAGQPPTRPADSSARPAADEVAAGQP